MKEKRGLLFKTALLSSALLLTGVQTLSAILPSLQAAHSGVSRSLIQQFISFPTIAQVVACLLGGMLAARFGKKRILLLGCICFIFGGIAPLFTDSFIVKIMLRLFLGAGIGLIQPLGTSMVADFFEGKERDNLMGIQTAAVGLGGIIMTFIVSSIIAVDWTKSYWVYAIGIPVFFLSLIWIPGQQVKQISSTKQAEKSGKSIPQNVIPKNAIPMAIFQFAFTIAFYAVFLSLSYAVVESGMGTASQASWMLTFENILSLLGGVLFGKIFGCLKKQIGPAALVLLGISFLLIGFVPSIPVYFICMGMAGIAFSWFMPFTITGATEHASAENSSVATSLVFTGNGLGGFLAAYIITGLGNIFGNTTSSFSFVICGGIAFVLAVIVWIYLKKTQNS